MPTTSRLPDILPSLVTLSTTVLEVTWVSMMVVVTRKTKVMWVIILVKHPALTYHIRLRLYYTLHRALYCRHSDPAVISYKLGWLFMVPL